MQINQARWLALPPKSEFTPPVRLRLYCFTFAGGSAVFYRPWQEALSPAGIEVCALQLPGRGVRLIEPPVTDMALLTGQIAQVIAAESALAPALPFAFFGHSLGALLAYEVAQCLKARGAALPARLFASGANAPQRRNPSQNLYLLPDAEFIEKLRSYNGTPPEALAHRELMEMVLPMIRADFSLAENYRFAGYLPLPLPITVLAGEHDEYTSDEQVQAWAKESSVSCNIHWFNGDHFFLNPLRSAVLDCIQTELFTITG